MLMYLMKRLLLFLCASMLFVTLSADEAPYRPCLLTGRVCNADGEALAEAWVRVKGSHVGCRTDAAGRYRLSLRRGTHTLQVTAMGHKQQERQVTTTEGSQHLDFSLTPLQVQLSEATVTGSGVERLRRSPYNALSLDASTLGSSSRSIGQALAKAPGVKVRESGGVGSDLGVMMDGFNGKHVKVFIDGVPQEGAGSSFGLNNIPTSYARSIEVYKGVVPVAFGTDALGGVVNIVTGRRREGWWADAQYTGGSFNTHKWHVQAGQTWRNGWTLEAQAFQNFSDNGYRVDVPVEDFETGRIDRTQTVRVKRFHDRFHNEAFTLKGGLTNRRWADRLLVGMQYAQLYKEVQNGVRQEIVYGARHRRGYSLTPSVEYAMRDLLLRGLDVQASAQYTRDVTTHIDTSGVKYNWLGLTAPLSSPGEQSLQHLRATAHNANARLNLNYRPAEAHLITLNHVTQTFRRNQTSLLTVPASTDPISRRTLKYITGLSYTYRPSDRWQLSAFGKHYAQYVSGPVATTEAQEQYVRSSRRTGFWGYGAAGTWQMLRGLQGKLSYEHACRLPGIEEMFGDNDLETGNMTLRPERSENANFALSYSLRRRRHALYAEGGLIMRLTHDYIQRSIASLSGGKYAAAYTNYGKVRTMGFNLTARYSLGRWLSVGGSYTHIDVTDRNRHAMGSTAANINYGKRMSNVPYAFADADIQLSWPDLCGRGSLLTATYEHQYVHAFSYYSAHIGANSADYLVPRQLAHNLCLAFTPKGALLSLSLECRNLTNARLYDNFSLQKAGRAFYAKVQVHLGNSRK